jgi:hypothetical protein
MRFQRQVLCSFSRFGLQDAQTPPSPLVGEGAVGYPPANRVGHEGRREILPAHFASDRHGARGGRESVPVAGWSERVCARRDAAQRVEALRIGARSGAVRHGARGGRKGVPVRACMRPPGRSAPLRIGRGAARAVRDGLPRALSVTRPLTMMGKQRSEVLLAQMTDDRDRPTRRIEDIIAARGSEVVRPRWYVCQCIVPIQHQWLQNASQSKRSRLRRRFPRYRSPAR